MGTICTIVVVLGMQSSVYQLDGIVMNDESENWTVDFTKSMERYPELRHEVKVRVLNNNLCLYRGKSWKKSE